MLLILACAFHAVRTSSVCPIICSEPAKTKNRSRIPLWMVCQASAKP